MNKLSRRLLALALVTAVVVPACSDDSSGSGGALTPGEFAQSYGTLICGAIRSCCSDRGYDPAKVQCQTSTMGDSAGVDASTFDAARAQRCLDQLAAKIKASGDTCGEATGGEASSDTPDCVTTLHAGTKGPGDPCSDDDECAPADGATVTCFRSTSTAAGYCQVERPGKIGQGPCYNTILNGGRVHVGEAPIDKLPEVTSCNLADGLYCGDKGCVAAAQDGAACDGDVIFACRQGSECVGSVCKPQIAVGGACDGDDQASCVPGAYCDAGTCKAKSEAGKPCTDDEQCASEICTEGACEKGGSLADVGIGLLCGGPIE